MCECTPDPTVLSADAKPNTDNDVMLNYTFFLSPRYFELPFAEYTAAVDRQLELMKRAIYDKAKDEWFKRQPLYTGDAPKPGPRKVKDNPQA